MKKKSILTCTTLTHSCKKNTMYINEEKKGRAIRWRLYHFYHLNPSSHFVLYNKPFSDDLKKKKIDLIFFFLYNT